MKKILLTILLFLYAALAWGQFEEYNEDVSGLFAAPDWGQKYAYSVFFTNPCYTHKTSGSYLEFYVRKIYQLSVRIEADHGTFLQYNINEPSGITPQEMDTLFYFGEIPFTNGIPDEVVVTYSYNLTLYDPGGDSTYDVTGSYKTFKINIENPCPVLSVQRHGDVAIWQISMDYLLMVGMQEWLDSLILLHVAIFRFLKYQYCKDTHGPALMVLGLKRVIQIMVPVLIRQGKNIHRIFVWETK